MAGAIALASCIISLIQMAEMPDEDHAWVIAGLAIAIAVDLLILNILGVYLSSVSFIHNLLAYRGYYYDEHLHNDYFMYGKLDD